MTTADRLAEIEARLKAADSEWHIRVCGEDVAEGYDSNCSFLENAPDDVRWLLARVEALEGAMREIAFEEQHTGLATGRGSSRPAFS